MSLVDLMTLAFCGIYLGLAVYSGSQIDVRYHRRCIPIRELSFYSPDSRSCCCRPYQIVYYTYLRNAITLKLRLRNIRILSRFAAIKVQGFWAIACQNPCTYLSIRGSFEAIPGTFATIFQAYSLLSTCAKLIVYFS